MLTPEQNDAIFGPSIRVFRIIGSYQTLSHASVKCIQTSIPPTSQPPNKHMPVDQPGMNLTANASFTRQVQLSTTQN